jgi:GDSL-like Lipase/Acylhydrolase family
MRSLGQVLLCFVCASNLVAQRDFYLKDGDTVVFYGDSITDQRLYTTFTEAYVLTRFPKLTIILFTPAGRATLWMEAPAVPLIVRLTRDVLAYQPTVVTLMLEMNDGGYRVFDPALFKSYSTGYEHIVKTLKTAEPKARITAIQPSPYDDVTRPPQFEGGYNGVLTRYGIFVGELATREELACADLNTSVVAALRKANQADQVLAQKLIPDRVHPSAPIHLLMAEALLKTWNAPAVVSEVEIDAVSLAVRRAVHTSVSELSKDDRIAWTQFDDSLPVPIELFPSEELMHLALRSADFSEALNHEEVTISGLTAGRSYSLNIDGQAITTHPTEEWSAGVNLSEAKTPMSKQAGDVLQLIYRHNSLHWARWHLIQTSFELEQPPSMDRGMAAVDTLDAEVAAMARAKAQPKPHRYELVAVE